MTAPDAARLRAAVAAVTDPELPMLTIEDLGILRDLRVTESGVEVDLTPTYSGCPATEAIRADVEAALRAQGCATVTVRTVLSPPWTTDWLSPRGRARLLEEGVAAPGPAPPPGVTFLPAAVACPRCGAGDTVQLSRFGPAPCLALRRCPSCSEPFEHMKPH